MDAYIKQIIEAQRGRVFLKDTHGRYMGCNAAFAKFVGLSDPDDIVGKTTHEILPGESANWAARLDALMFERNSPSSEVYPFSGPGGSDWQRVTRTPLLDDDGELVGLIGSMEDVNTAVRRAEELARSRATLTALSEVMPHSSFKVIIWDAGDLNVSFISDNVTSLGFPPAKIRDFNDWRERVAPEDAAAFDKSSEPLRQGKNGVDIRREYGILSESGGIIRVSEQISSVNSPGAHFYRSVLIEKEVGELPENPGLTDIADPEYLRILADRAASELGVFSGILDENGEPLAGKHAFSPLCLMIRSKERGGNLCRMSEENLCLAAKDADGSVASPCDTLGLFCAAQPVTLLGRVVGYWVAGRVKDGGTITRSAVSEISRRLELDEGEALAAFENMPGRPDGNFGAVAERLPKYVRELEDFLAREYLIRYRSKKAFAGFAAKEPENFADGSYDDVNNLGFDFNSWLAEGEGYLTSDSRTSAAVSGDFAKRETKHEAGYEILNSILDDLHNSVYMIKLGSYELVYSNREFGAEPSGLMARGQPCYQLIGRSGVCPGCCVSMLDGQPDGYSYLYETDRREPGCRHLVRMTAATWNDGSPAALVTVRDVTEDRMNQQALLRAATHDMLLKIPNLDALAKRLTELIAKNERGFMVAVQITNLKLINAAYGHKYGNALIKEVTRFLKERTAPDTLFRRGTGVLTALVPERAAANELADAIKARFAEEWDILDKTCFAAFTGAIVPYPGTRDDAEGLLRDIEVTLDNCKPGAFAESDRARHEERMEFVHLADELHHMVKLGCLGLEIQYQPVYDVKAGRYTSVEALMRWRHAARGYVPPRKFIDIAEDTGLIIPLSEKMLEIVIKQAAAWAEAGIDISVSVNFSAAHSRRPGIADYIGNLLKKHGVNPNNVCFEIPECLTVSDREHTENFMISLLDLGCRVAIDDFGTGLTSLDRLDRTPVTAFKIDRLFIYDITENKYHAEMVKFAVGSGKITGANVICKGIERVEQLDKIRELGADFAQGFYFSPPVDAEKIAELFNNKETNE